MKVDVLYMHEAWVAHEHVCGFVVSLCFVIVVFLVVDGGLCLFAATFQMMTWPDLILK